MTLLIVFSAALAAAVRLYIWKRFWQAEGRKLQQSGYLPPAPSPIARLVFHLSNRLIVFLAVGPVKVIGRKNLRGYRGRLVVVPNHTQPPDWALVNQGVDYERYTASTGELAGVRGFLSAWSGCFGVNSKQPGGGQAVVDASVNVLASKSNASLLLFPQGKLVADNVLRPDDFHTGAVRIMKAAAEKIGAEPLAALPVAIHYKQDATGATWFHRLMRKLGLKWFRNLFGTRNYGAVVVVGKPIPVQQLPEDPHQATELLRTKIAELLAVAQSQQ